MVALSQHQPPRERINTFQGGFFTVGDLIPVPGTATECAQVFNRMQLVTGHLASHGVIFNAEA